MFIALAGTELFAKDVVLGGKNGWPQFQQQENITSGKGRYGYDCIELASNSFIFIGLLKLNTITLYGVAHIHPSIAM